MIYNLNVRELIRFDNLSCQINTILEKMLSSLMIPTCSMIQNVFEVELGHINTRHPDFILGAKDSLRKGKNCLESQAYFLDGGRNKEDKEDKKGSMSKGQKEKKNSLEKYDPEHDNISEFNDELAESVSHFS